MATSRPGDSIPSTPGAAVPEQTPETAPDVKLVEPTPDPENVVRLGNTGGPIGGMLQTPPPAEVEGE